VAVSTAASRAVAADSAEAAAFAVVDSAVDSMEAVVAGAAVTDANPQSKS
jgi:hypothetical protein